MFERLKRLYDAGSLTNEGLKKAVAREWIGATQYQEITGEEYSA